MKALSATYAVSVRSDFYVRNSARCGTPGGVTVLAINLKSSPASVRLSGPADLYQLTAPELQGNTVLLNGRPLKLRPNDELPAIEPARVNASNVALAPTSISFIALPKAKKSNCPG